MLRGAGTVDRADLAVNLRRIVRLAKDRIGNRLCGGPGARAAGKKQQRRDENDKAPSKHFAMSILQWIKSTLVAKVVDPDPLPVICAKMGGV